MPLTYNSPEAIYIQEYCNKYFPDVDYEDEEPYLLPSGELDIFLAKYDTILTTLPKNFTKEAFYKFELLQQCLENINWGEDAVDTYANQQEHEKQITLTPEEKISLRKDAFWGFMVFMYFSVNGIYADRQMPLTDLIEETNQFITANIDKLKIKLTAGRKSREITHPLILKALFAAFHCEKDYYMDMPYDKIINFNGTDYVCTPTFRQLSVPIISVPAAITERHKSYIIIKTTLSEILHCDTSKKYYPQTESILCLCVLHFCGYLLGETSNVCDKNNIITLTKLLKDFQKTDYQLTKPALFSLYFNL